MKKKIFAAFVIAISFISSPAVAKWQDGNGKDWDTIDQCLSNYQGWCVWVGKMVNETDQISSQNNKAAVGQTKPTDKPLAFTLVKPGDIIHPDEKKYCLHADQGVSNMPVGSSTCPTGTAEVEFAMAKRSQSGVQK